jgi:UDP-GlcNAc:undecaprenyl-phosphate GlcNAc-1-phosphate transferase
VTELGIFLVGACASASTVLALSVVASRAGLTDDPSAAPHRKLQARPVPAVGGAGILVGLGAIACCSGTTLAGSGAWIAVLLAFALGLFDDRIRGGLPPLLLILGQSVVAATLLASGWRVCGGEPTAALAASLLAVLVALNAFNAFDNADGAATSLGILGFCFGSHLLAAPLIGFLPFNFVGNPLQRGGPVPTAYLGNSGSHLLGILLLLDPVGRVALLLPVLDLLRVSFVRLAAGARPWVGDRRHLAHRLQRRGLSTPFVALILIVIALPALLGAGGSSAGVVESSLGLGAVATLLLFGTAVRLTPEVQ